MKDVAPPTTRRGLLAGIGVGATSALAGCSERLWSQAETPGSEQVSLTIKTVPADDNRLAASIASHLRENYRAAGIDATHEPVTKAELYRDILLEGDYDVFVARHPGLDEYDALRGLLHSRFRSEHGWQNPFQFSDVTADDYLDQQRVATESDRRDLLTDLIDHLAETAPYTVVAYPHPLSGASAEITVPSPPRQPQEYIEILSQSDNGPRDGPLEVGVFGEELTERLNPLTVDRNRIDGLLDLLYDPLARRIDGEYVPWLAEEVEWTEEDGIQARVTLREGLEWHDGESLDAEDVAFTLRFIGDTSMGDVDGGVPAPRYRSQQTLVSTTNVVDSQTVVLSMSDTTPAAARRVLTIPVLPEHIWDDRSELLADRQTRALADDNDDPIGSGLFSFADATTDLEIELEPFEEHVLRGATTGPDILDGFSQFEGITFRVSPNPGAMVEALIDGEIDVTASELPPQHTEPIRDAENVSTITGTTDAFYMIGYNNAHDELSNPYFRRVCSRLIDREHVVSEFFETFAQPAASSEELVGVNSETWGHDNLETDDEPEILRFPGTDGEVNTSRVRSLFQDIGYRYENEELLE
ncbi:ABC transporter substrate-binding protein [Natronorubrum sp. JWXQ-INN-674]|uniref:ABC transporter substrate-binding protein n=1 Tax=Natronorubrum halalkaliphilum TaxID=2691917 RepID=A0A6B0VTB4_9EURY|nr:ABC transporter substrate-binding protein [Natronorubrum halalkaliphilum]MXV64403.1 ABC transporter substrate-binding protein [Natronorubrum halalkaliphilum]